MRVVVPFRERNAKTGLAPVLDRGDREELARLMLLDVLEACSGLERTVVAQTQPTFDLPVGVDVEVEGSPLNEALGSRLDPLPVLVVPADVPLVRERNVGELLAEEGDVVVAPGLRGGTNALLLREGLEPMYGGRSFERHVEAAEDRGLDVTVHESFRFAVDMDAPGDLTELEIHGTGGAADFARRKGI